MNKSVFSNYALYYNLLYQEKDYNKEAEYIHQQINKYGKNVKNILEIGTGTGKHAKILQEFGYSIMGIERSDEMAAKARENGINCITSDASIFSLDDKFDCSIALFHVISYITENDRLIKTFKNIYDHLNSGGIFLFDIWYSPAVYNIKPETRIKRIENEELKIIRLAEPVLHYNSNIVDVNYEVIIEEKQSGKTTHINEIHPMRHFSIPEIQMLASFSGLEILETEEWMTGNQPSEKTWGVCFVLRKVKEKDKDEVEQ